MENQKQGQGEEQGKLKLAMEHKQEALKAEKRKQGEDEEQGELKAMEWNQGEDNEGQGTAKLKHGEEEEGKEVMQMQGESKGTRVRLKSADNCIMEVEWEVAKQFEIVNQFEVDPEQATDSIPIFPLENVTGDVLSIVIDFCRFHSSPDTILGPPKRRRRTRRTKRTGPPPNPEYIRQKRISAWETKFFRRFDLNTITNLVKAASYLNIQILMDAACEFLSQVLQKSSLDEIRAMVGVENDLTPEEEAAIRQQFGWAFTA